MTTTPSPEFQRDLESLLNRHSQENGSDTPDYILACYLLGCLQTWNLAVRERDAWSGRGARVSGGTGPAPVDPAWEKGENR